MESMGDRLRQARTDAGFKSAAKAAAALGVKPSTYAAHENGQNEYDPEVARHYGRRFGVSAAYLLTGDEAAGHRRVPVGQEFPPDPDPDEPMTFGSETGSRGVPPGGSAQIDVTGGLGDGGLTIVSDGVKGDNGMSFAADHVADYWRLPPGLLAGMMMKAHQVAIIPVQGDSMHPTLMEGDFVFVDTRHRVPSPDGVYVIADQYGGVMVKRLHAGNGKVRIISDNSRHEAREVDEDDLQIIGRVVRKFTAVS